MDSRVNAKALVRLISRAARHFSSVSSVSEPVTPIPAFADHAVESTEVSDSSCDSGAHHAGIRLISREGDRFGSSGVDDRRGDLVEPRGIEVSED